MDIRTKILNLAAPLVKAQGLEIWGLEFQEASGNLVRLFVETPLEQLLAWKAQPENADAAPPSATIDQCEEISRQLGLALEVEDLFPASWTLEVSTPGLERKFHKLPQLQPYIGDLLEIRLLEPLGQAEPGRRVWRGKLLQLTDDAITIEPQEQGATGFHACPGQPPLTIPWEKIRTASRIHLFQKSACPGKKQASRKK